MSIATKLKGAFTLALLVGALLQPNVNAASLSSTPATNSYASIAARLRQELALVGPARFTTKSYKPGLVRHIVLLRYKDTVTKAERDAIAQRFLDIAQYHDARVRSDFRLPYIVEIETGLQNSGEQADQGLEQAFLVTFESEGDRNYFVGQPIVTDKRYYDQFHQAFKDFAAKYLTPGGMLVFDYKVSAISDARGIYQP